MDAEVGVGWCCITDSVERDQRNMLQQRRDTKDLKPSHAKLSWSLSVGLGERHEYKTLFVGEGVFHESKLLMPHQLFLAMCGAMLEAVLFAIRIGFLSSIGGGIAATLCADPVSETQSHGCLPLQEGIGGGHDALDFGQQLRVVERAIVHHLGHQELRVILQVPLELVDIL